MRGVDAHAAFGKLANETRVDILRAVAAAGRDADAVASVPPVPFAELRRAVGMTDSGKFNYHLTQLTGTFLRKTDDGYTFTYAGERVVRTILSGAYGEHVELDPVSVDAACPSCGAAALALHAEPVEFVVRCGDCERSFARHPLSPGVVADRDPEDVPRVVADRLHAAMHATVADTCDECGGGLDGTVREAELPGDPHLYVATCRECWAPYRLPLALWVFEHPATVSFFWERDVDVLDAPFWELLAYLADGTWHAKRADGDPAYRVTLRDDGDELAFSLDDDLAVTNVARSP